MYSKKDLSFLFDGLKVDMEEVLEQIAKLGLDEAAENCSYKIDHPDWSLIGGRLLMYRIQQECSPTFTKAMREIRTIIKPEKWDFIEKYGSILDKFIKPNLDFTYNMFSVKTLMKGYLIMKNDKYIETPQYQLMRESVQVGGDDITRVIKVYKLLSEKKISHASPIKFGACLKGRNFSSCFLKQIEDDLEMISLNLVETAMLSKSTGGIGLSWDKIRHSSIGDNGESSGIVPFIKVYNEHMKANNQQGKRKGSSTNYLSPWHKDIRAFIDLKKQTGKEELRARDLNYCLWMQDEFYKRVINDEEWSLFCPNEAYGLSEKYGEEFSKLYNKYETDGKTPKTVVKARDILYRAIGVQKEAGEPFMCNSGNTNRKSNHKNMGYISNQNLCLEIAQYCGRDKHTGQRYISSCNLGALVISSFVKAKEDGKCYFDWKDLSESAMFLLENLDNVVGDNKYKSKFIKNKIQRATDDNRPVSVGVIGMANAIAKLDIMYEKSSDFQTKVYACMYHSLLVKSNQMAISHDAYPSFYDSPMAEGKFQFDLWNEEYELFKSWNLPGFENVRQKPTKPEDPSLWGSTLSWDVLRSSIVEHGTRHSLVMGSMPTASTAQILGVNECFEPFTLSLYTRRVLSGDFLVWNRELVSDLEDAGLWSIDTAKFLIANDGDIAGFEKLHQCHKTVKHIVEKYKSVYNMSQKTIIDICNSRGLYVDQSQSLNIHMEEPTTEDLFQLHIYAWMSGCKTGMYYLRTSPPTGAKMEVEECKTCSL
jgi:ribonucleoside-diphosphate reductase alpha chain